MAILHNLATITDNLSGFDPVAGISGTVGKSWLLWKLFEGLAAFDSNIKKITNASPTPTFLQGEVGSNLQTEPTQSRATNGDSIRFYHTNDPGLSQTPASAMIYEWKVSSAAHSGSFTVRVRHLIDGGTTYAPGADNTIVSGNTTTIAQTLYITGFGTTTTNMALIPKVIFYKTSNMNMVMGIEKADGTYRGYLCWYNPEFVGYKHNVGEITEGLTHRGTIFTNANGGHTFIEAISQTYDSNLSSLVAGLSPICLTGQQPTGLFTFSSINNLIGSRLRFGLKNDANFKTISDEIEGVLLANPTAASQLAGQIYQYNSVWYLHLNTLSDGRDSHKILLELGT